MLGRDRRSSPRRSGEEASGPGTGPEHERASEREARSGGRRTVEPTSEREGEKESRETSEMEGAGATRCTRERTKDCLGMSARVPTPVALAPSFGTPSCPPHARVIAPPSPFHFVLSPTKARAARLSSLLVREVLLLSHGSPLSFIVASFASSSLSLFLLAHNPPPLALSLSLFLSFFLSFFLLHFLSLSHSEASSLSLFFPFLPSRVSRFPFLSVRCLSLPPDIRIDSSTARARRSFSPPRFFSLCEPRPRTIFISTTCLAVSERASERSTESATSLPLLGRFRLFFRIPPLRAANAFHLPLADSSPMHNWRLITPNRPRSEHEHSLHSREKRFAELNALLALSRSAATLGARFRRGRLFEDLYRVAH